MASLILVNEALVESLALTIAIPTQQPAQCPPCKLAYPNPKNANLTPNVLGLWHECDESKALDTID